MSDVAFTGIPLEALDFYERLEADNTRAFWDANRPEFQRLVREPCRLLGEALGEYGPFHLFRPNNDLRFSKNKPLYKTHQGCYGESQGGAGHYFQLSSAGLRCGSGYYAMAKDQLERYRAAVDDATTGPIISQLVDRLERDGSTIGAIGSLKTAPRGYPKDHPRITLLRLKGLVVSRDFGAPAWLPTTRVVDHIRDAWQAAAAMNAWLDDHVGPSELPPEGFFR